MIKYHVFWLATHHMAGTHMAGKFAPSGSNRVNWSAKNSSTPLASLDISWIDLFEPIYKICVPGRSKKNRIKVVHNQCYFWFLISVEVKTMVHNQGYLWFLISVKVKSMVHNQGYLWFLISVKVKPMVHNQGYLWFLISVKVKTMVHIHGHDKNNGN